MASVTQTKIFARLLSQKNQALVYEMSLDTPDDVAMTHPMAFQFPSRLTAEAQLFFPTVHIHDGEIHKKEKFDHILYAQTWLKAALRGKDDWTESQQLASQFTDPKKSQKLIWGGGHVYRQQITGVQKNIDIIAQPVAIGS